MVPALGLERWRPVLYMARHTGASLDLLEDRICFGGGTQARLVGQRSQCQAIREAGHDPISFLAMTAQQRRYADIADTGLQKLLRRKLEGHDARSSRKMGRIA